MIPKQENYSVGIYLRLSKDDEREGESLSIDNQRKILVNYVTEQGWDVFDTYIDDGYSGTDFNRPGVQRMLDDAKNGRINLIICKDLSRFGRNYIQVGQYTDYIFPMYNIRFIALTDNVDTANSDSTAMDMMPIMNVFNEWHSANTSKKLKSVYLSWAKTGKYKCTFVPYGYIKGNDEKCTPIVDPQAAQNVLRIFELRASGLAPQAIAERLNADGIAIPSDYLYQKMGKPNPYETAHLWSSGNVRNILSNPIYVGDLVMHRSTTVSHKNHKKIDRDESEWIVHPDNHEAIVPRELWNKVKEMESSVSHGKRNKQGYVNPLSGLLYCQDCGYKMKQCYNKGRKGQMTLGFICGYHGRYGRNYCTTHHIRNDVLEKLIIADVRDKLTLVVDEDKAREQFLKKKSGINISQHKKDTKRKAEIEQRMQTLDKMIQSLYEDKVLGKITEDICFSLIEKNREEKNELQSELDMITERLNKSQQDDDDVNEFISRLKKYASFDTVTREMALELIEYITVEEKPDDKSQPRQIHIYYKFLDKPVNGKMNIYND